MVVRLYADFSSTVKRNKTNVNSEGRVEMDGEALITQE